MYHRCLFKRRIDSNLIFKKLKNKNITAFVCKIPDKDGISKNLTDVDIPKKICKEFYVSIKLLLI